MIGGIDSELIAPVSDGLFDRIVAFCRRHWPEGVFVDANETRTVPLASPELAWRPPSTEFFIFRDARTEATWDDLGPCPENWNRMLHFLCRSSTGPDGGEYTSVTVVVDELTPEIRQLLDDLQETFLDAYYFAKAA